LIFCFNSQFAFTNLVRYEGRSDHDLLAGPDAFLQIARDAERGKHRIDVQRAIRAGDHTRN